MAAVFVSKNFYNYFESLDSSLTVGAEHANSEYASLVGCWRDPKFSLPFTSTTTSTTANTRPSGALAEFLWLTDSPVPIGTPL